MDTRRYVLSNIDYKSGTAKVRDTNTGQTNTIDLSFLLIQVFYRASDRDVEYAIDLYYGDAGQH